MTDMHVIAEIFASLDGRERYHEQLELWAWWNRRQRSRSVVASKARWRKKYPDKARARSRKDSRNYYRRMRQDPEWVAKKRAYVNARRARKKEAV